MNRRDFLGLLSGGAITAALMFLGLRKDVVQNSDFFQGSDLADPQILGTGIDAMSWCDQSDYIVAGVDPASPDGDLAAVVTMEKTPEGWIITDWEDKE